MIGPQPGEMVLVEGRLATVEFLWWASDEPACHLDDGRTLLPLMDPWEPVPIDPDVIGAGL